MNTQTLIAATDSLAAEVGLCLDNACFEARQGNQKASVDSVKQARNKLAEMCEILDNLSKSE